MVYRVRNSDWRDRANPRTAEAEHLDDALGAAWALQRYTESPVVIVRDDDTVVAVVNVEWVE